MEYSFRELKSNACVPRTFANAWITHFQPPFSARLVADVRPSVSAEMGGILVPKWKRHFKPRSIFLLDPEFLSFFIEIPIRVQPPIAKKQS